MSSERFRSSLALKLGVLTVSTLIALGAVELGFRIYVAKHGLPSEQILGGSDQSRLEVWLSRHEPGQGLVMGECEHHPILGWVPMGNLHDYKLPGCPPLSTNSVGMRGSEEFTEDKPEGCSRVALIGDSFTFGTHQPDSRTWATGLRASIRPCEVLNFAVPGYGSDQAVLSLTERALRYEPDVVVWGFFVADGARSLKQFSYYAKPRLQLKGNGSLELSDTPVPTPAQLVERKAGGKMRSVAWQYLFASRRASSGNSDSTDERELLELNRALLARAQELVHGSGAKLLVLSIPRITYAATPPEALERGIMAWAEEIGYEALDLRSVFAGQTEPMYIPGRHFSPRGHRVVAGAVRKRMMDLGWL